MDFLQSILGTDDQQRESMVDFYLNFGPVMRARVKAEIAADPSSHPHFPEELHSDPRWLSAD